MVLQTADSMNRQSAGQSPHQRQKGVRVASHSPAGNRHVLAVEEMSGMQPALSGGEFGCIFAPNFQKFPDGILCEGYENAT